MTIGMDMERTLQDGTVLRLVRTEAFAADGSDWDKLHPTAVARFYTSSAEDYYEKYGIYQGPHCAIPPSSETTPLLILDYPKIGSMNMR